MTGADSRPSEKELLSWDFLQQDLYVVIFYIVEIHRGMQGGKCVFDQPGIGLKTQFSPAPHMRISFPSGQGGGYHIRQVDATQALPCEILKLVV